MIGIAKRAGVKTINVVRRSEQKDELLRLGCGAPALPCCSSQSGVCCHTQLATGQQCSRHRIYALAVYACCTRLGRF